jgi:hypothetical protein
MLSRGLLWSLLQFVGLIVGLIVGLFLMPFLQSGYCIARQVFLAHTHAPVQQEHFRNARNRRISWYF